MKNIIRLHLLVSLFILLGAAPPSQKALPAPKISIQTHLDKTAVWVGDRLNYTVRAIHDSDVEFVLDNLKEEKLRLAPFVVHGIKIFQGEWADKKKILEVTFALSSYETGKDKLTIPSFTLYYFLSGDQKDKKESAAETFLVPPIQVGLRSTLSGSKLIPREVKPATTIGVTRRILPLLLGVAGMIFLAVCGARWVWRTLHRERSTKKRLSRKSREKLVIEHLGRIRAIKGQSPQDLILFYGEVSHFLREYLNQWLEIEAAGLTPEEIEMSLRTAGTNGSLAEQIRTILEQCDEVRYTRDGLRLGKELQTEMMGAVEKVVVSHGT